MARRNQYVNDLDITRDNDLMYETLKQTLLLLLPFLLFTVVKLNLCFVYGRGQYNGTRPECLEIISDVLGT